MQKTDQEIFEHQLEQLNAWTLHQATMMQVLHGIDALLKIPENSDLFVRKTLWDGIVTGYARGYIEGSFKINLHKLDTYFTPNERELITRLIDWRHTFAGHHDRSKYKFSGISIRVTDSGEIGTQAKVELAASGTVETIRAVRQLVEKTLAVIHEKKYEPLIKNMRRLWPHVKDSLRENLVEVTYGPRPKDALSMTINPISETW